MYFITKVSSVEGLESFETLLETNPNRRETEVLGYFYNLERAVKVIESREIDRVSCSHGYLVIEKIGEGLLPRAEIIQWYFYNDKEEEYEKIEDLESIVINFAKIG